MKDIKQLQQENDTLRSIIANIWWMARRYADGRSTYVPGSFNQSIDLARMLGVKIDSDHGEIYAEDGMLGIWVPAIGGFVKEVRE